MQIRELLSRNSDLDRRSRKFGWSGMWIEKLFAGVLRVLTPLGPRYIRPSLAQRIYLLWVFRNFQVLPLQVLTRRQRRVIDALCVEPRFVSLTDRGRMGSSDPRNAGTPPADCPAPRAPATGWRTQSRHSEQTCRTPNAGRNSIRFGSKFHSR